MKSRQITLGVILALGIFMGPYDSEAQQPGKVYHIGYLAISPGDYERDPRNCPIAGTPYWQAFVEGLRERGYIQGQNLVIECRWTEGREERAPALAAELVSLKPDLIACNWYRTGPCGQAGHQHDPHRHGGSHRPRWARAGRQPRPPRRQRHGADGHGCRDRGETSAAPQGGRPQGLPRGRPLPCAVLTGTILEGRDWRQRRGRSA